MLGVALLCCAVAGLLVLLELQFRPPTAGIDLGGKLSQTQSKAIDVLLSLVSLFVSFALSVLGGIAFFLTSVLKNEMKLQSLPLIVLSGAGVVGILSVYFGHLVFNALIGMLANDILTFQASFLLWPMRLQYVSLLLALTLFISAVVLAAKHGSAS